VLEAPEYPGAVAPERSYDFDSRGFRLRLHEWGDPKGEPVVLCHGMWDHSRGFDLFAPRLAEHYRVIAIDARGHGDSDWADSYTHAQDVRDIVRVVQACAGSEGRVRLVGHSKGGGQATNAAVAAPERVHKLVNIEGFGPPKGAFGIPGRPAREPDSPEAFVEFLDSRRKLAARATFPAYPALDDLVERRKRTNPRLSTEWLRYFAWHGAERSPAGFRFKADPLAGSGAGPFRVDWIAPGWSHLRAPMLAMNGKEPDTWGLSDTSVIAERLAYVPSVERVEIDDAGHFPHMEQPERTARVVLDFLQG
jgi:pimeloyl-ACP methyl ester carboxylesterase